MFIDPFWVFEREGVGVTPTDITLKLFSFATWGESHGKSIGCVVDGVPSKIPLDEKDIQKYLDRRKPGQSKYTTQRKEKDNIEILSGVFEDLTTGHPISLIIKNEDQRSKDWNAKFNAKDEAWKLEKIM